MPGGRFGEWAPARTAYVIADVDGTLVGHEKHASAPVVSALRRAQAADLFVGYATARLRAGIEAITPGAEMRGPHILLNGAEVWHGGEVLRAWPLDGGSSLRVAELCRRHGWYGAFYTSEQLYVTDRRREAERHWDLMGRFPDGSLDHLDMADGRVLKVTVMIFGASSSAAEEELTAHGLHYVVSTSPQEPNVTFINVTDPGASKGVALAVALKHLRLARSQVVALGDGPNDLPLLHAAGTAVAMGQSPPPVKDAAHFVVPNVDSDGAVQALEAAIGWATKPT